MNKVKVSLTIINIFVVFLLGFYFYQVQDLVKNSFSLNKIQQELSINESTALALGQQSAVLTGLDKTEQTILSLNFVKNDNIKYIPLTSDFLVRAGR